MSRNEAGRTGRQGGREGSPLAELPRLLQEILSGTSRRSGTGFGHVALAGDLPDSRARESPEQILPRSSLGLRQWGLSADARTRKAQELIRARREWAGVEGTEKVLEIAVAIWDPSIQKIPARPEN
jgi:hypothetical protein